MISLTLLMLIGAYVGLFILAWKKSETWRGRLIWWAVLLVPLVYTTWDIPVGYYQFRQACENESGLKVFEKTTMVSTLRLGSSLDRHTAKFILRKYPSLHFVEAQDVSKKDMYFLFSRNVSNGIEGVPLNVSQATLIIEEEYKKQGIRLGKVRWILKQINGGEIAAYTQFSYSWSNPEHTLFGRSGGPSCYQYGEGNPLPYVPLISLIAK